MNLFHHLSPEHHFRLIREKLEEAPASSELSTLLEACLAFDLLRPSSLLARVSPYSDEAADRLCELQAQLQTLPEDPGAREALLASTHHILDAWVGRLYVDGGFKPNGRSAWAVYDAKRDSVRSGRGHCGSSTEAEWKAVLQGCKYAAALSETLILIYTDAISILDQLEVVEAQSEAPEAFAWARYHNPRLLELYDYLNTYPIDLRWASREEPGIARADQACNLVLARKRR